jgi:hypothetical protein
MSNRTYFQVLDDTASNHVPNTLDLMPNIAARLERKPLMMTLRARPVFMILLVFLALALLSGVAYALGKVLGYVPGVGIVDQSVPVRILTEPVIAERDGLTVTVSQVVADSDRTFVAYAIDGLFWTEIKRASPMCGELPFLQLPDGTTLNVVSGGEGPRGGRVGDPMNFETTVSYSPIPSSVNNVAFTFPCILTEGAGTKNWQIPLKLLPAPKDYATPGVEVGATFVSSNPKFILTPSPTFDAALFTPEPYDPSLPATPTQLSNGSGLYLEKVIELPNSYILIGNFADVGDLPGGLSINDDPYDNLPRIEDGAGIPVAFNVREDLQPESGSGGRWARYWAFEIKKPVQGPLTITLDQINIGVSNTAQFNFDTGSSPQIGQKRELNLPIHLGKYDCFIDSVEVIKDGYLFKYHSGIDVPEGVWLSANIVGSSPETDSSEVYGGKAGVEYSQRLTYLAPLPTGQLIMELTSFETVPLQGPWVLIWTPPNTNP